MTASVAGCAKDMPTETTTGLILKDISVTEAHTMVQNNLGKTDFVILDVRTPPEFADGHIEGAIMIDFNAGNFRDEAEKLDKNKRYLVYCRTGNRSGQAAKIVNELGFKEVYNMDGGFSDWVAAGYPSVR
jgi:rhodanese-related sulfurtransferase